MQNALVLSPRDLVESKRAVARQQFTLEQLIDWLKQQNPSGTYNWNDCFGGCLLGQYLIDVLGSWQPRAYQQTHIQIPNVQKIAMQPPWTFGAALERAEQELVRVSHDS